MTRILNFIWISAATSLSRRIRSFFSIEKQGNNIAHNNMSKKNNKESFFKNIRKSFFGSWLFSDFFRNLIIRWLLVGSLLLNLINWILLTVFIRPVDFKIILHYNVYFGVDLIGDWWQPYIVPFMGILFLLINAVLAYWFYQKKERIASYILLIASLMIQVGSIISSSAIVLINY